MLHVDQFFEILFRLCEKKIMNRFNFLLHSLIYIRRTNISKLLLNLISYIIAY